MRKEILYCDNPVCKNSTEATTAKNAFGRNWLQLVEGHIFAGKSVKIRLTDVQFCSKVCFLTWLEEQLDKIP